MIETLDVELKDEINVERRIKEELKKLRYNFSYKGTMFLQYAIYILYGMNNIGDCDLKSEIYPIVAKKYNTNVNNVKCNIRNATEKMYYDCEQEVVVEYIGVSTKPTAKMVIKSILKNIETNIIY